MKKFNLDQYSLGEKVLMVLLVVCLIGQGWYLINASYKNLSAQGRTHIHDGTGGPSAPAQPGAMQPRHMQGRQHVAPPPGSVHMQPPPGRKMQPGGGTPGMRPGGRVTTYPVIPKGRKLTERDKQIIETRYLLHRWVLSDMLWGVVALEKSKKYKLTDEQVKKIYPSIKKLATSVEVVEESNRLMKGLLTDDQIRYFEIKLYNGAYMSRFMSRYSPGVDEPVFGISELVYKNCKKLVEKKAKKYKKK